MVERKGMDERWDKKITSIYSVECKQASFLLAHMPWLLPNCNTVHKLDVIYELIRGSGN